MELELELLQVFGQLIAMLESLSAQVTVPAM